MSNTPACREHDPDLWFREDRIGIKHARAICNTCPLREACLANAILTRPKYGVWAGLTPRQRGIRVQRELADA